MTRRLIVNSDDFGQSPGVNRGILRAHEAGIVTSTSVLVRWPAAVEVSAVVSSHPRLGLGLHVDLGEWGCRDHKWYPLYRVLSEEEESSATAVSAEVDRQLAAFRRLTGKDPTHLDSHQHVHRDEPLRSILLELGTQLGIPVRHFDPRVRYVGDFYGQTHYGDAYHDGIAVESLIKVLRSLQDGVHELCCHPGIGVDHASPYALEREIEVRSLCDARVADAVRETDIELIHFGEIARA